ncbi:hypothetical protein [Paenibacillus sp. SN-8-1]|uniref:hypothetical protein n=1 Tax=Paenibacillus sp. SN-8-1 TaxID=3435409 RepID=UPI003D9A0FF7
MNTKILVGSIEVIAGLLINIYISRLAKILFKKDGVGPRTPLRVAGIYLIINGFSRLTG